jgi:hypothetical protein
MKTPIKSMLQTLRGKVNCTFWSLVGECKNGHQYAKELLCGREWCPECGKKNSKAHRRRYSRWLPKVQQINVLGYLIITFPPKLREKFRDPKILRDFDRYVKRLLKREGYSRGFMRWHFFGNKPRVYHPHLNILLDHGFMRKADLKRLKHLIKTHLNIKVQDIKYQYDVNPGKKFHLLKYVTRATFLDLDWDCELAMRLYNFRNMISWGSWKDEPVWEVSREDKEFCDLEQGICPICGEEIEWFGGVVRTRELTNEGFRQCLTSPGFWKRRKMKAPLSNWVGDGKVVLWDRVAIEIPF